MKKRLLSLLLICCMVLCFLPVQAQAGGAAAGAAALRNGIGSISGYNAAAKTYDYIYYGVWRNAPIKWRVLDTKDSSGAAGALFLLTDECLYPLPGDLYACYIQFNPADKPNRHLWKDSTLQGWFKNTFYSGENSAFTSAERALIPATTQEGSMYTLSNLHMRLQICALEAEHVFAPSIQDIMNADYGFTDSTSCIAGPSNSLGPGTRYWLRSFEPWDRLPFMVGENASLMGDWGDNPSAVRPAMNLTTTGNNILFISAAEGGKPAGGLAEIPKYARNDWKLTLLDSSRSGFSVTTTSVSTTDHGGDIQIEYSGAKTGPNEYISVLLKDDDGNPTYYGRSAALTEASGSVTIPVAAGLTAGEYTLYVYNEQYNGDKRTDYASELQSVSLTVAEAATYTVTYGPGTNGTGTASTATKLEGAPLTLAGESFTRTGYTQTGWATRDGGEMAYALGAIYENDEAITLYPVWTANQYTVTLDSNGGSAVTPSTVTVTYGEDCPTMPVLQWAGHIFYGWYDAQIGGRQYVDDKGNSAAKYDKTSDCTLYAQWSDAPLCTVTFDPNGGVLAGKTTSEQRSNDSVQYKPDDPTREGHNFTGWYQDPACTQRWDFSDWVTGNMTLYAGWRILYYTIYFDTAGGSAIGHITQNYGTAITAPTAPTKTGYTFIGWSPELPATMPAKVMTVIAQWRINQYTITFDTAGGSEVAPITQDYGTAINAPAAPTKTGYTFIGWDTAIPATMPAHNMTITAQWTINQYTITFDTAGGSEVAPITQNYGTTINAPAAPTKTGYTFIGWDSELPATMPAENVTVTAQWRINSYTVTLDPNGGRVSPDALSVTYLTPYGSLPTPVRSDYRFDGWYLGDEKIEAQTVMTQAANHTLTARWTFQPSAVVGPSRDTLTLEANGGSPIAPIHAARGTTLELSALQPEKSGFRFTGWYLDKALTLPVTSLRLDGDQTVYAGWVSLELPFRDVRPEDWFYDDVRYVYESGLMNGTAEGLFSPDLFTSRAMIVTVLWRLSGSPVVNYYMPFADVDQASWYAEAVRWAASCGIVTGYDNGNFGPNDPITREQLAAILYRCAAYRQEDTSIGADTNILSFTDAASVSEYAVPALQWACGAGILQGADGALLPAHPATRAQTAAMLARYLKNQ